MGYRVVSDRRSYGVYQTEEGANERMGDLILEQSCRGNEYVIADVSMEDFWIEEEEDFDDSAAWEDDSDRGCKDCPPSECTGHCMSCFYRPV